jgi:hypothetical protein
MLTHIPIHEAEKEVLDTGLVFAINTLILHPLGLALAFSGESAEEMTNIQIMRNATGEPIEFGAKTRSDALVRLRAFAEKHPNNHKLIAVLALIEEEL